MKNFLVVMILLVISVVAYGNASPPTNVGNDCTYQVVSPDNFVFNAVAMDVEVCTYSAPELAKEESFYVEAQFYVMVREVTACRKISLSKAESGVATENSTMALNSTCTDNNVTQSPPLLCSANVATNNYLVRNLQHNNFGYPLSAN